MDRHLITFLVELIQISKLDSNICERFTNLLAKRKIREYYGNKVFAGAAATDCNVFQKKLIVWLY